MMRTRKRRSPAAVGRLLLCSLLALAPLVVTGKAQAPAEIAAQALPAEARATLARIRASGPFPYERDGVVFGNRERLLPTEPRGYYLEYTVPTPGVRGRGARRIVCGGRFAVDSECYYSDDHYRSFRKIEP
jgi:ribonuclease T1